MADITDDILYKYQVTVQFTMDDAFMGFVPAHRLYINSLIEKNVLDSYTVSMEVQRSWMVINAKNKEAVEKILSLTPLYQYWTIEINEIFVFDGSNYRLPAVELN